MDYSSMKHSIVPRMVFLCLNTESIAVSKMLGSELTPSLSLPPSLSPSLVVCQVSAGYWSDGGSAG